MVLNDKKHRSEQVMGQFDKDKQAIVKCARWLSEHGYFGCVRGSGGNISIKLNRQNMMAITPSRRPYQEMSLDDICVVDAQMQSIEGHLTPSVEATMHLSVYNNRPDVSAVIHTHPVFASILSVIDTPIPALFDEIIFIRFPSRHHTVIDHRDEIFFERMQAEPAPGGVVAFLGAPHLNGMCRLLLADGYQIKGPWLPQ
jgi:ribulose-5-phosphate 4-epimerase/fuculose-1-phosphate aldolase